MTSHKAVNRFLRTVKTQEIENISFLKTWETLTVLERWVSENNE